MSKRNNRRLAAIMFSDICAYSSIMNRDEALAIKLVGRHNKLIETMLAKFHGNIIKFTGDGVLAEFHSTVNAVESAIQIQRNMQSYNERAPEDEQFHVRIGIHMGDVVITEDDIIGDGVNIAARIEPLAEPGGICISQDVYNQVHNKIQMDMIALGPQDLKNIAHKVNIFRVLIEAATGTKLLKTKQSKAFKPGLNVWQGRWPWLLGAGVVVLIAFLLIGGVIREKQQRARVKQAITDAETSIEVGELSKAENLLTEIRDKVKPDSSDAARILDLLQQVEHEQTREAVAARAREFILSIINEDWPKALAMVDPDFKAKHPQRKIIGMFKMLGGASKLMRLEEDDIRMAEVFLAEDGKTAMVAPKMLIKEEWKEGKPCHLKLLEGKWYIIMDKKKRH
ncbi:adenylate/guanylate cyclase domain-containing protein [Planctomycetota bacterium]